MKDINTLTSAQRHRALLQKWLRLRDLGLPETIGEEMLVRMDEHWTSMTEKQRREEDRFCAHWQAQTGRIDKG